MRSLSELARQVKRLEVETARAVRVKRPVEDGATLNWPNLWAGSADRCVPDGQDWHRLYTRREIVDVVERYFAEVEG